IIDLYMDKQAEEIRNKVTEARVERFSKGIRIIFDTEVLFSTDSATINPESSSQIEQLALILAKYADTDIFIEVHADTITAEPSNPGLSERRADSIASILWLYRVSQRRFSSVGYHEPRPNATSETETWSLLNNRTVMLIHANNELKRLAKAGELRL
ncbi:MAG: OmpA family protein, partial [Chlorobiaceae bacterium]|nr:OmpA family protein [Chlorobiaceae bacterium]